MNDIKPVLWLAIEDYSGLWEAVWQLRGLHSKATEEALTARAKVALRELLARDLVKLYRCQEPYGDMSEVQGSDVNSLLAADESWREPSVGDVSIRFGATPAGQEAYPSWPD